VPGTGELARNGIVALDILQPVEKIPQRRLVILPENLDGKRL